MTPKLTSIRVFQLALKADLERFPYKGRGKKDKFDPKNKSAIPPAWQKDMEKLVEQFDPDAYSMDDGVGEEDVGGEEENGEAGENEDNIDASM